MHNILKDFLERIVISSTAGAGGVAEREAIKGFALPRHGADMAAIDKHMLPYADTREDAITRVLGLREFTKGHVYTPIGEKYLSKCINKQRILQNQFKKWHFVNAVNSKDKEAKDFSVYPYWIVLEFFCMIKSDEIVEKMSSLDFLLFVVTIRKREDIQIHIDAYNFAKKNSSEYEEFKKKIPSGTEEKFIKGHWNQVFGSGFFEHIIYDSAKGIISLEPDANRDDLKTQLNSFYSDYKFDDFNSNTKSEYIKFLQNENEEYEMFPSADISFDDIKKVALNIDNTFKHKNIVLKGVPGTGKSRLLTKIIENKIFKLKDETKDREVNSCLSKNNLIKENVLRINIHSASANSDLMQGIGIATDNDSRILYSEKQGLILKHIEKAYFYPLLPFVLILEEIQENSLNELIGDLIYLIEVPKRAGISKIPPFDTSAYSVDSLIEKYMNEIKQIDYVELPSLIDPNKIKKMIFPDNLYVFCTSNYRDDKKVIEDNLLRRFDVIEVYPQYSENYEDKTGSISSFLLDINSLIIQDFKHEVHPDRFQIGHSNWLIVKENDEVEFYKAFLKIIIEFKEIREIEYETLLNILKEYKKQIPIQEKNWVHKAFEKLDLEKGYSGLINQLQDAVYKTTVFM